MPDKVDSETQDSESVDHFWKSLFGEIAGLFLSFSSLPRWRSGSIPLRGIL